MTNPDGSLTVFRPKGQVTVGADGVRCNGTSGEGQSLYGLLAKNLRVRATASNTRDKALLAVAAKECWNLSPELNDAIMECFSRGKRSLEARF